MPEVKRRRPLLSLPSTSVFATPQWLQKTDAMATLFQSFVLA
jgi:hypothetical protein